jgi:hypothetical protein
MARWILAAIGVLVLSIAIQAAYMFEASRRSEASHRRTHDAAAWERTRQIDLQYEPVSLVSLLAAPERYDGRKVEVEGFVTLDFEDSSLHLDEAAYKAGLRRNAIWLDRPKWLKATATHRLNRRYGEVAGTFDASASGHMGLYSGALTHLRRIRPTFTQADFVRWQLRNRNEGLLFNFLRFPFLTLIGWGALLVLWVLTRRGSPR